MSGRLNQVFALAKPLHTLGQGHKLFQHVRTRD